MSRLLPFRQSVTPREDQEPRLVEIDDDAADEVFEALSSKTARTIFSSLHDEPATASDLAEIADTSLQNVRYHLDKLADAGLVEVADTWYSERGREMKVYAPANTSLVMVSGGRPPETTLRDVLSQLIGGIGVLALASVLFDQVVRLLYGPGDGGIMAPVNETTPTPTVVGQATKAVGDGGAGGGGGGGGDAGAGGGAATATETAAQTRVVERTVAKTSEVTPTPNATTTATGTPTPPGGVDGGGIGIEFFGMAVPPGAIFFVGGLFVLLLAIGWYYYRSQTPYAS